MEWKRRKNNKKERRIDPETRNRKTGQYNFQSIECVRQHHLSAKRVPTPSKSIPTPIKRSWPINAPCAQWTPEESPRQDASEESPERICGKNLRKESEMSHQSGHCGEERGNKATTTAWILNNTTSLLIHPPKQPPPTSSTHPLTHSSPEE